MDREIWNRICAAVRSADRRVGRTGRRPTFSDQQIVKMLIWVGAHDRPLCWGCDRRHYNRLYRPTRLPSISQFCRRVKTGRVQAMLAAVNAYLTRSEQPTRRAFLDGKAMILSDYTHDADARTGRASTGFAKGYKLHALATQDGRIPAFAVTPLNVGEPTTARTLTEAIEPHTLVLADANYDSCALYQAVADRGARLLTPLKGRSRQARGLRRMPLARRRAIGRWDRHPHWCVRILHRRDAIDRVFGAMVSFGGGLHGLPPWVRGLDRVTRWITVKVVVYHARLQHRHRASA
jgi:IS5 family transposase